MIAEPFHAIFKQDPAIMTTDMFVFDKLVKVVAVHLQAC